MSCPYCGCDTTAAAARCPSCHRPLGQKLPPAADTGAVRRPDADEAITSLDPLPPDEVATGFGAPSPGERDDEVTGFGSTAGTDDEAATTGFSPAASRPSSTSGHSRSGQPGPSSRLPQSHLDPSTDDAATGFGRDAAPRTPDGPLGVGESFGTRYHIIRLLGLGGMGAVYQAWDAELGVAVALKVVRPEVAADPAAARDLERRFKRELLLARQVTHRNVVRIHDLGEIDGIKYITMPYVEGQDLATLLATTGKLPVARVLHIARGIAAGLAAAHQAGVVHRDLKPANIMIGADDEPLIMDFGIARSSGGPAEAVSGRLPVAMAGRLADQTMSGAIVGTVQYMAPEQARGESVDQRADIYAFGLILYDMLLGHRRAKSAPSAIAELQERMRQAPPALRSIDPSVPEEIDHLVARCVEADAGKRFATSAELSAALDRLDDLGRRKPEPRRITRPMAAAAAVAVVALVSGAFYTARQLTAPAVQHDPRTVVIADFTNTTGDPSLGPTLEATFRRALEGATFITAYDRGRIRSTFGTRPPDVLDETAARELAVRQGLGVVVSGRIEPWGTGYTVSVKAVETVSKNVIADISERAAQKSDVLETTTELAARVRQALGDDTSESAQRFAMRSLSTASLDAVGYYANAMDAQSRGRSDEAFADFKRAVTVDPKFGLGYQGLAAISLNQGKRDDANRYIKEALRYLDGMTERERMSVRGLYYTMTGDYDQCAKEYRELIRRYSADTVAQNQLATCLAKMRDMRGAVEAMQRAVAILPKHVTYRTNLAVLYDYAGDFPGAEKEVRTIESPDEAALLALAFSQIGRDQVDAARETYQRLGSLSPVGKSFASSGLGDLALYQGRYADAIGILQQGASADLADGNPDGAARKLTSIGYAEASRNNPKAAAAAANIALSHSHAVDVRVLAAHVLLDTGDDARAKALADDLELELTPEPQAYGKLLEGAIFLKHGDSRRAIKSLTESSGMLDTWLAHFELGRAYLAEGAYLQADAEFDRCIKRRGEVLSLFDEDVTYGRFPIVYYYQGRVREALGTAAFADSYRIYLSIRGGSSDDPLVADVRRRTGS